MTVFVSSSQGIKPALVCCCWKRAKKCWLGEGEKKWNMFQLGRTPPNPWKWNIFFNWPTHHPFFTEKENNYFFLAPLFILHLPLRTLSSSAISKSQIVILFLAYCNIFVSDVMYGDHLERIPVKYPNESRIVYWHSAKDADGENQRKTLWII